MVANRAPFVFVGTYTRRESPVAERAEGIYVYRLDPASGRLSLATTAAGLTNPSFLALSPDRRFLYAVNEVSEDGGEPGGAVSAFAVDAETGTLTRLNHQSTRGAGPCHLSVDATGRFVLVANYSGGSVAMLPIDDDGSLRPASDFHQHTGSSVNERRQKEPHGHSITLTPDNRFALACDLGLDKVLVYRLDRETGKLVPNSPPAASTHPGAGPRHLDIHPSGRFVYVINELDSTMTAFRYDSTGGTLTEIHHLTTLPEDYDGTSYCADVHVAPSGRFVYGSNRGHDSIVIFAIDQDSGRLTLVGHEPTRGSTPRNFALDPTGTYLFAANQSSDTIVVFRIDQSTGQLTATGDVVETPSPVCLKIASPGQ